MQSRFITATFALLTFVFAFFVFFAAGIGSASKGNPIFYVGYFYIFLAFVGVFTTLYRSKLLRTIFVILFFVLVIILPALLLRYGDYKYNKMTDEEKKELIREQLIENGIPVRE